MGFYNGDTFANGATFHLDGSTFIGCTHIGSTLIYSGGELPTLEGSVFQNCQIHYSGNPERLQQFVDFLDGSGSFVEYNLIR